MPVMLTVNLVLITSLSKGNGNEGGLEGKGVETTKCSGMYNIPR